MLVLGARRLVRDTSLSFADDGRDHAAGFAERATSCGTQLFEKVRGFGHNQPEHRCQPLDLAPNPLELIDNSVISHGGFSHWLP